MHKTAVYARGLIMSACMLLTMTACSEEELVAPEENGGADNNTTITTPTDIPMRTIRISAGMADGEATRTTLNNQRQVLWDEGDQYTIINDDPNEYPSKTLRVVLNEPGSGLGVKTDGGAGLSSGVDLRYSGIKVVIGGEDVTSKILSTDAKADNSYMVGVKNSNDKYQYAPAGQKIDAKLYGSGTKKTFYIARSTSTDSNKFLSKDKEAVITLTNIQWKYNLITWWYDINENNGDLVNGGTANSVTLKNVKSYKWVHGLNSPVTLTSEAGKPYGIFEGQIPVNTDITESTMAVYPAGACTGYNDGKLTISIPQEQSYVENSFDRKANIMVGPLEMTEEDEYDATFKNMMGVLQLTLTGADDYLSEITVTDKAGKPLWGTATLEVAKYTQGISVDMINNGTSTITLNCNGVKLTHEPKTFHFVVPAGAFANGFDVNVKTADKRTKTISTSKTTNIISTNHILKMPEVAFSVPLYELNLHNEAVETYLSYTDAPGFDTDVSLLTKYKSVLEDKKFIDMDRPQYFETSWNGDANSSYHITFTDDTKGKPVFTDREVKGTSYAFMNMIPGHEYSFTVTKGTDIVTAGKFKTKGQVREVTIEDAWNYRDLGGWTSTLGGTVQYEWLYRGGSLNGKWNQSNPYRTKSAADRANAAYYTFSETSNQQIRDLGIRGELDLRSIVGESGVGTSENTHTLALGDGTVSNVKVEGWIIDRIKTSDAVGNPLNDDALARDAVCLIDHVLAGEPFIFHCKSGADRTGAVAILTLGLLGVSEADIARDYELTTYSHENIEVYGSHNFTERRVDNHREAYSFYSKGLDAMKTYTNGNLHERCYYYLNRYFRDKNMTFVNKEKLDAFIEKMLGKPAGSFTAPSWAQ